MRRSARTLVSIIVTAAFALTGCGSGYSTSPAGRPADNQCLINPVPDGTGVSAGGGKVTGSISIDCGSTIMSQSITMKLLHSAKDASSLAEVNGGIATYGGSATPLNSETLTVDAKCTPGWWQLQASVTLTVAGQGTKSESVPTSAVELSAENCASGAPVTSQSPATTDTGQTAQDCVIKPSPANGPKHNGRSITGGLQVVCPDKPQRLHVVLYLEYASTGADWRHDPGWGDSDTADNLQRDLIVHAYCRVGTWRFNWSLTGTDHYGKTINVQGVSAETYVDTCP